MSTRDNLEREAGAASDKLHDAGDALKQHATDAAEQAKVTASSYAEQGVDVAATGLGDFADAVRKAADKLNERDQGIAARLVTQAADGLEQAASSISGSSLDDMMASVQRFARQNPAAFVGVAVLGGIALGRFARSSSERSHAADDDWSTTPGYRTGMGGTGGTGGMGGSGGTSGYRPAGTSGVRGGAANRPAGSASGTASAGRPMAAGTGPASGRATVAPASSTSKK